MKIGLLPFYIELYDKCSPKFSQPARDFAKKIAAELRKRGLEVFEVETCRLEAEFDEAVKQIEAAGCTAIATLHLAYSPSLEAIGALSRTELPVVVIDTTPDFDFASPAQIMPNHGIHGVQDFCNLLLRHRKPFLISAGHWEKSDCLDRAVKNLAVATMAYEMSHIRVGKIGGDFKGMGDFTFPQDSIGIQLVDYTPQPEPTAEAIEAEAALDAERFVRSPELDDESYRRTLSASLKLRSWLEAEQLKAFTVCFCGVNRAEGWETVPFLECSKAIARGLGYAGEGDALTAAMTYCLAQLFPQTSFMEMFCPDWSRDRIFTSHMGEINIALCGAKPLLAKRPYTFSDTGEPVIATGCFKAGDAVLTDLAPGPNGSFTLITAPVTWLPQEGPSGPSNAGWFKPQCGSIADFLAAYSEVGGTHHLATSYGATTAPLRSWAKLMKWNYVELA